MAQVRQSLFFIIIVTNGTGYVKIFSNNIYNDKKR